MAGSGFETDGGLYSYGSSGSADRALGSIADSTFGGVMYGFRFVNNDAAANITGFTITYTGEQWRNGGSGAAQTLRFSYGVFASEMGSIGNETVSSAAGYAMDTRYTAVSSLDFVSPRTAPSAGATGGNGATSRTVRTGTVSDLSVANNQEIWVRFVDVNDAGANHALAVDDFTFTAVFADANTPEPSTLALTFLGASPLGSIALCRKRAKKQSA